MATVITNEGNSIQVTKSAYDEMQRDLHEGVWAVLVRDISGNGHMVILTDNFSY